MPESIRGPAPGPLAAALALILAASPANGDGPDGLARQALDRRGDPGRGRAVFRDFSRGGCTRCHRAGGEGGDLGPDLSDVGAKLGREHLIESVLRPSRQVVEGYRRTVLALADGRVVSGIVKAETPTALVLVDADLKRSEVPRSEVEERRLDDASIMPEGIASGLSTAEFVDLIDYLQTLRSEGQAIPSGDPLGSIRLPEGFGVRKLAGGISAATALAVSPDGRVFVCEQTGALRVVKSGSLLPAPFATFAVDHHWERGLIGVAIDPGFAENGRVYVHYVAAEPSPHHRIARLAARGDVAGPGGEEILLEGDDQGTLGGAVPAGHQGGAIHFGRDGRLYAAIGDQTARTPSQSLETFQGKLLRIGPDGTIPADNPFSGIAKGKYRAIWALGFRNPFTFAVQGETGRIFVNDVGESSWEEVDEAQAGGNYGWPEAEGPTKSPKFRGPIHAYPAASISGGAFCPSGGSAGFPERYRGKYFFMDFVKGWIRVLDPEEPGSPPEDFASGLPRPVDLAFRPDGGLVVLIRDAWVIDESYRPGTGSLVEIRPEPGPSRGPAR